MIPSKGTPSAKAGSSNGSPAAESTAARPLTRFPIVAIGASAGGLEAFSELLKELPQDTGMAFVLIQHLDRRHASYLSEALRRVTELPVVEITDGLVVQPNHVYVIPSNADVGILGGKLTLLPRSTEAGKRHLPIDFFFEALAAERGPQAIGIVLSGTGSDGTQGLRAIKAEDGVTFAQEPGAAKFSGMPEAAIATGAVDFALPIVQLAEELVRIGRHPFLSRTETPEPATTEEDGELRKILLILRHAVGVDFSEYKLASIRRRVVRRMVLQRVTTLEDYVPRLREDPAEARALFEDILIHVTCFFRDPQVFERLKQQVFPEILKQKREGGTIRIWSAGCSSGEEAYSLVIALLEFLAEQNASDVAIQLFGTDISELAVEQARAGNYPETITREVSAERLARFFTKVESGGYRINKSVRERCAFVRHDLARDPPFSKLDIVICRNLLIYFGQELQTRVLGAFQFSLNQPGFLVLGRAENIPDRSHLFSVSDKDARIFARTAVKSTILLAPARDVFPVRSADPSARAPSAPDIIRRTDGLLLDRYAPPGVIVNERMEILHFRGRTGPYLEPAPGQPQHDLLKMAREGLLADLRIALSEAQREKTTVRRTGVSVKQNGSTHVCDLVVFPVASPPDAREHVFAVIFEEPSTPPVHADESSSAERAPARSVPMQSDAQRVAKLEAELQSTKDYLRSIIDEHQRTNEELMSANEEMVSSNEELQSLNEELQTAKEELESSNEELSTLNEELHARNSELDSVNSDLVNILGSVEVPIVIVDAARRIRRFTPNARPILNLLPSDVGRPIDHIKPNLAIENLDQKIADVIDTITLKEEETQGRDGRWYRLQIRPYTTVDKRIDGAVLSIIDIDVLKRALGAAEWARDYARATVEAIQTPLLVLDQRLQVSSANEAFHEAYGLLQTESAGRSVYEVMNGAWDIALLRTALERVIEDNERFQELEVERELPRLGRRSVSLSGRAVTMPSGQRMVLLAVEDITARLRGETERAQLLEDTKAAKASAEDANRSKDVFLATLSHELRTPLSSLLLQAELLRRGNLDEARLHKASEAIERATKAQAQLIEDLLDISRIVAGKLKMALRPLRLCSVVEAAVEAVAPIAARNKVEIELHLDESMPAISGDPLRLQQVVSNLLTNAIKFTPARGRVVVTVASVGGRGRVQVADTGMGIEPEFLPHIFSRFSQEDRGQTRAQGGLGLGLAIVRYLAEAHGGSVQAESPGRGRGSTFTVLLPVLAQTEKSLAQSERPPSSDETVVGSIDGSRVLIVEDDPGMREALTEMLILSGAEVWSAESAAQAMILFEELKPDLLVCDIAMPNEDGYSLLGRIRALGPERGGNVPAVALTALASDDDRRRAFAVGFQKHIAKPVDFDGLLGALADLLKRSASPAAAPAPS